MFQSECQPEGILSAAIIEVMVCASVHPLNAFAPIVVTLAPIVKSRLVHPSKAFASMVFSPPERLSRARDVQLTNALSLIVDTPFFSFVTVTLSSAVQFANILS